ncbi:hypothetical protein [Bacillus bombysepticus]|uniref:hypothetical protein n=1 Tax=Bacillus bombysepticus TaxID=658666 RepID=UPI00301591D7
MGKGMKYEHFKGEWKELYESGKSFRQISKLYKVDAKTVNRTLKGLVKIRPKSEWVKYYDEWYDLHVKKGIGKTEIARRYKCSVHVVMRGLEKKGIKRKRIPSKRLYDHLAPDFKKLYKEGKSLAEIGEVHNVNAQTVLEYLNADDVEIRELSEAIRHYDINEHYFDVIDEAEKAFNLGVLFATGSALEMLNAYCIQVTIHTNKKYIISPLIHMLRGKDEGGYTDADSIIRYRFSTRHLYEKLRTYGMNIRSKMDVPNIDNKWYPAFYAGYMSDKSYIAKQTNQLFISGSKPFLTKTRKIFAQVIPANKIKIHTISENQHHILISDNECIQRIQDWLKYDK